MSRRLAVRIGLAFVVLGLIAWLLLAPPRRPRWNESLFAGVKVGDPDRPGPGPELQIIDPKGATPFRHGRPVEVVVRAQVAAGGTLPTALRLVIEQEGVEYGSAYPQPEFQADGTFLCRWQMDAPHRSRRYRLRAQCEDWIVASAYASMRTMVKKITTEAAVEVTVE